MTVYQREDDFTVETTHDPARPRTPKRSHPARWHVGDQVRVADGPRMLIGATGTVVELDAPGPWPIRVQIDRRGFSSALLAAHELGPADEAGS
ncbi:hypothetical protein [Myceligenerans salitolerans]|uniref:DUF1918 domain-containing protein n=1 Tax=Myceligenerans salitolerans TaxID=1230528 RepID=A0ABS3ICX0_9MICO|nr:hypothetical protein [Myceligenerans salitolerans]MBO0610882.1 hypothetical protein [Myceligenerans salitolerans]